MTIDNHPLTPKPVDDREAGVGYHQPTKADRETLEAIDDALGFLMDDERAVVLQAFARHREQAERGLREAAELLQRAQAETFGGMVGGGDGGTYVVKTLSGKTLNDIRAFLTRKALDTRP